MTRLRDDVYAVEGGTILYALKTPSAYGYRVYVKHLDGSTAMYGHLSEIYVKDKQEIKAGERLGTIGETGNCPSGKHLHMNYFSRYSKGLTGKDASDPTFWIQLGSWPTNTIVSGGFAAVYTDSNGNEYPHEGIDFSYNHLIPDWEKGTINSMKQEMRILK